MPKIEPGDLGPLLRKWLHERPEGARFPRVAGNPFGDNTLGIAYDDGFWAGLRFAEQHGWHPAPSEGR